ncbi:MAG: hypothetical protein WD770_10955 [Actinomycetota bacterium]
MHRLTRPLIAGSLVLLLAAACGDDPQPATTTTAPTVAPTTETTVSPTPTGPIDFDSGEATFEVTGDETASIDAQIDPAGDGYGRYDPEDGEFQADFRGGDDGLLRMTLTFDASGALTDAFIAIGLGGGLAGDENYYFDGFHTQCDVTTDPFDGQTLNGSFTCDDLPEDDGDTIDAEGTFNATSA